MATLRSILPVGSAQWVVNEAGQVNQLVQLEAEEFTYGAALHEIEWLNEHMAEIFNGNQINVADVFKTPGKLRGKTPRTARKRNALENRAPLTDIFAPNSKTTSTPSKSSRAILPRQKTRVIADQENSFPATATLPKSSAVSSPVAQRVTNTDSGYHDLADEDMDFDAVPNKRGQDLQGEEGVVEQHSKTSASKTRREHPQPVIERCITEESYVSAKENLETNKAWHPIHIPEATSKPGNPIDVNTAATEASPQVERASHREVRSPQYSISAETASVMHSILDHGAKEDANIEAMDIDEPEMSSGHSSPEKPLMRKSSLTFASLPAREPLGATKSLGPRPSRNSQFDNFRHGGPSGNTLPGKPNHEKSLGTNPQGSLAVDAEGLDDHMDAPSGPKKSTAAEMGDAKAHNKTSTQLLHERINMLGKPIDPRPSKSISSSAFSSQPNYPQLPVQDEVPGSHTIESGFAPQNEPAAADFNRIAAGHEETTRWNNPANTSDIRPQLVKSSTAGATDDASVAATNTGLTRQPSVHSPRSPVQKVSPTRPVLAQGPIKSVSASAIPSTFTAMIENGQKNISVSNPTLNSVAGTLSSNASAESQASKKYLDGPLTASKAKLYSVLKSAKGIFASSASVSADAKMEALSPHASRVRTNGLALSHENASSETSIAAEPQTSLVDPTTAEANARIAPHLNRSLEKLHESSTARSSAEREEKKRGKEIKEQQRADSELEKARAKERQKAAAAAQKPDRGADVAASDAAEKTTEQSWEHMDVRGHDMPNEPEDEADIELMPPPVPAKSLLPAQAPKAKENRRLAKPVKEPPSKSKPPPMSIRVPSQRIGQAQAATGGLSTSLHDPTPPPVPQKQQTVSAKSSNASLNTASSSNSLKSSTTSTLNRPKALEAAARKKEEDERIAQKKAEKKREMEQRKVAKLEEDRRAEQQREAAQREAAQRQRLQDAKRAAAQKQLMEQKKEKADELATALQQERMQAPAPHPRADLGTIRPVSRMNSMQDIKRPLVPQINPAKPRKRPLQPDSEDDRSQNNPAQKTQNHQQLDAKRRKTIDQDEEDGGDARRSVLAPPIRQSQIRKEPNKFPHGYVTAHTPSHPQSMLKSAVTAQQKLQHAKFAGHPNDMAKFSNAKIPFAEAPNPPAVGPSSSHNAPYKTPVRAETITKVSTITTVVPTKSSPHYPAGENIALPEILTDSEESETENDFAAPSWVNSPALRELLTQQQLVDPEQIFGPIAPLHMEEIFKNKDRHKRFRDRTSSANWSGADRLTEEERRRDREGREKLMREGGWTFHTGA